MTSSRSFKIIGFTLLALAMSVLVLTRFLSVTVTHEVSLVQASERLMDAIYNGSTLAEIAALVEAHPEWAREPIYEDWYAVHCAAQAGREDVLQLLLDHGADINERGPLSVNAIVSALDANNPATLAFVLDHGADPHVRLSDGATPLDYVREHGSQELQQVLDHRGLPQRSP